MNRTKTQNDSVGRVRPVWPARPAAARLRRTRVGPILARPPIRATQPCARPPSDDSTTTKSLAWQRQNVYEMTEDTGWFCPDPGGRF
jgi:hypothetical protein